MSSSKPHIILLASYPKSGNTWMRSFISTLEKEDKKIESFSDIKSDWGILSSKGLLTNLLGVDIDDLTPIEAQQLRYKAYEFGATIFEKDQFVKTHDTPFFKGIPIIPKHIVKNVILIVRNPFDMVASYANHLATDIEKALFKINSGDNSLAKNTKLWNNQVTQFMGSWSDFHNAWINYFRDNITIIKYEDMLSNPLPTFKKVVNVMEHKYADSDILAAIEATQFDKLQKIETEKGFSEKGRDIKFFRQGKSGNWKNEITQEMANQIIDRHYHTLLELNYIDSKGNILV